MSDARVDALSLPPVVAEVPDGARLLDVRWALDGSKGRATFEAGHLPGAVYVDLPTELAGQVSAQAGRHPLPEPADFAAAMSRAGVSDGDQVVVYDDTDGSQASRLVWMLRALGVSAALLDGGLAAQQTAGVPLATGLEPAPAPGVFTVHPWSAEVIAQPDEALPSRAGTTRRVVIDARAPERYRGDVEPMDPRAGHIPGAVNVPFTGNVDQDGRFLAPDALRERFEAAGVHAGDDVIVYCGSGVTATHDLVALEQAGITGARLLPGSWSQWSADPDRPVETGDRAGAPAEHIILIPDTMPAEALPLDLPEGWRAVGVDAREEIPAEHRDAEALVVWGASRRHLASAAASLPRLRLVQSLSAGMEGILAAGFDDSVILAGGTGLHSRTVAEHTLALVLSLVRRLPESADAQARHDWSRDIGGIQPLHPGDRVTTLLDARVLIWGFGDIGQTLAPMLEGLGAHVTGAARSAGERAGFAVIEAGSEGLSDAMRAELARTDILIDILPASEETSGAIGTEVLQALPARAYLVNVGRGATVDQASLIRALVEGEIAGAALDVTDPEPPEADDPIWDAPHLIITPHSAGGRPVGARERIAKSLSALEAGTPIAHRHG